MALYRIILDECKKDKFFIDLENCFQILAMYKERLKLEKAVDQYTLANCVHFWWLMGHRELLEKLIEANRALAVSVDVDGNTPLHYLWLNSVSTFADIQDMYSCLKSHGAKGSKKNIDGKTCSDILKCRIKANNPYDVLAKNLKKLKSL